MKIKSLRGNWVSTLNQHLAHSRFSISICEWMDGLCKWGETGEEKGRQRAFQFYEKAMCKDPVVTWYRDRKEQYHQFITGYLGGFILQLKRHSFLRAEKR